MLGLNGGRMTENNGQPTDGLRPTPPDRFVAGMALSEGLNYVTDEQVAAACGPPPGWAERTRQQFAELHQAIGEVTDAWSRTDFAARLIVAELMGSRHLGRVALEQVDSFQMLRLMFERLIVERSDVNGRLAGFLQWSFDRAEKAGKKRNSLAHNQWSLGPDDGGLTTTLLAQTSKGQAREYTLT